MGRSASVYNHLPFHLDICHPHLVAVVGKQVGDAFGREPCCLADTDHCPEVPIRVGEFRPNPLPVRFYVIHLSLRNLPWHSGASLTMSVQVRCGDLRAASPDVATAGAGQRSMLPLVTLALKRHDASEDLAMHMKTEATRHLHRAAVAARTASHLLARLPDAERNTALRRNRSHPASATSRRRRARRLACSGADVGRRAQRRIACDGGIVAIALARHPRRQRRRPRRLHGHRRVPRPPRPDRSARRCHGQRAWRTSRCCPIRSAARSPTGRGRTVCASSASPRRSA